MNDEKICLFHLTKATNVDSIKKHGLLTRRDSYKITGTSIKQKHSGLRDDPDAVYLGKRDSMNYPFALENHELAMLKVCIPEDDAFENFYPDEDYIRDEFGESEIKFEEDYAEEWENSLEDGYGVKYKGSIHPDKIVDCEIGMLENDRFEKTGTCKW